MDHENNLPRDELVARLKFRIVPMTWITGVERAITRVLTSESGGNLAGVCAAQTADTVTIDVITRGNGVKTEDRMGAP